MKSPHELHCVVARNADNPSEFYVFDGDTLKDFPEWMHKHVTVCIGHNFLGFDLPSLNELYPQLAWSFTKVVDTLVCSRLFNLRFTGGHSVENYASRFVRKELTTENVYGIIYPKNLEKVQIQDWSQYNDQVRHRCITDTLIQWFIFNYLSKWISLPSFRSALRTEHFLAWHCRELEDNGFAFDVPKAETLRSELNDKLARLDHALATAFPPKRVIVDTLSPRRTKNGTMHAVDFRRLRSAGYTADDIVFGRAFDIVETQEFNPGSLKQTIERLNDAGWKPTEKTKGHAEAVKTKATGDRLKHFREYGWRLSEENLRTLPPEAPGAAKKLVERLLVASRVSDLDEWLRLVEAGLIHGQFFHIGSWTQRMSTSRPNMQNIPVPQHKDSPSELDTLSDRINSEMRELWIPEHPSNVLVGTDADGIQMRVFAHYVNDPRLTEALTQGKKEDGTDIHSVHWRSLQPYCKGRNPAKTFIYAWLLGAGKGKVAEIFESTFVEAGAAVEKFIQFYPGLSELKKTTIPRDAERGYFIGLDNRFVMCDNEHLMLAGYLQNGEKIIMARALQIWKSRLSKENRYFISRNFVHDEWQTETSPDEADYIGQVQADSIRQAGEELNLNCPLAGNFKIGRNWLQTH